MRIIAWELDWLNFACNTLEIGAITRVIRPICIICASERFCKITLLGGITSYAHQTKQPPAKAGGLVKRTESPDTGQRPVVSPTSSAGQPSRRSMPCGGGTAPHCRCQQPPWLMPHVSRHRQGQGKEAMKSARLKTGVSTLGLE